MAPTSPRIELHLEDLERVVERARHTPLSDDEYATLKAAIHTLAYVAPLVEDKGTTIAGLRQIRFGARTEKTRDVLKRAGLDAASTANPPLQCCEQTPISIGSFHRSTPICR